MQYAKIVKGQFLSRPNRFVAHVCVDGDAVVAHVKNTGRCRELLMEGCNVYLSVADSEKRKTAYDLVIAEKCRNDRPPLLINLDSQAPNEAVAQWLPQSGLFSPEAVFRREVFFGSSRFDFCIEEGAKRTYLEVKGVTLEEDGVAMFPDAPTERGVRHVKELIACREQGYGAMLLFVVQMKGIHVLCPNDRTHPAFGAALRQAAKAGVAVFAMDCIVTPNCMTIDAPIPVNLEERRSK